MEVVIRLSIMMGNCKNRAKYNCLSFLAKLFQNAVVYKKILKHIDTFINQRCFVYRCKRAYFYFQLCTDMHISM